MNHESTRRLTELSGAEHIRQVLECAGSAAALFAGPGASSRVRMPNSNSQNGGTAGPHSPTLARRTGPRGFQELLALLGPSLWAAALLMLALGAQAGVALTSLHSFGVSTNGVDPGTWLVQGSDGNLYGTTYGGGTNGGHGTIFKISTNGVLTSLYSFTGGYDGAGSSGLVQGSDGNLYGTTAGGGTNNAGTVFKIGNNGAFTSLYSFTGGSDGNSPAELVQGSNHNFYGTTSGGAVTNQYGWGQGTVFRISTNGALTTLYSFTGTNDGAYPSALVQGSDGSFYGTTYGGGATNQYGQGQGTVFRISTNGVLTTLYSFTGANDGAYPQTGLVRGSDGNFYGTTSYYDSSRGTDGTVFQITPDGTLTTLYTFNTGAGNEGYRPRAKLVEGNDGYFYGTTRFGGAHGSGTVFQISTNGALTSLYSFTGAIDGAYPVTALVEGRDGYFYGTTPGDDGSPTAAGTIFRINSSGDFTTLYSFTFGNDGAYPQAALVQAKDGKFYGTTVQGGAGANPYGGRNPGTVFQIGTNSPLTNLYSFSIGVDGHSPTAGLAQGTDGNLYGTASGGGYGTVFKITTNGAFTRLYSFTGSADGETPNAGLVQGRDGRFYGTTSIGANVFRITAAGALTVLASFSGSDPNANPQTLAQGNDGNFYGTTSDYNIESDYYSGYGSVFKMTAAGTLATLHAFNGTNDGANPRAGLLQAGDGSFYGTTSGGLNGNGTVFKIGTNGVFTSLYFFTGGTDGAAPLAGLVQGSDANLYGTTSSGGAHTNQYGQGYGTVFRISTNGSFTSLYSFTGGNDGANPKAGLVQGSEGSFYGTTYSGGAGGAGTVFRLTVVPAVPVQLTTIRSGVNVILSWPTNATGFVLQSATTLANGGDWQDSSLTPTEANGQKIVTITPTGPRGFFRLRGP